MSENILLLREPSAKLAEGQVSHIADQRDAVDPARSVAQWQGYAQVFERQGWTLRHVAPTDAPDGVFIEDQLVFFAGSLEGGKDGGLLMQCSPGSAPREPEVAGSLTAGQALADELGLGFARLTPPATLDGGDILKLEDRKLVFVGVSARTNEAARNDLRALLTPRGYTVVPVPVNKALHLKSAVTALPDGTIIGYDPIVDEEAKQVFSRAGLEYLAVPEEHGVAVVVLGPKEVVMSADAPATKALWESRGLTVHTADIGDFEKLEGCVTCLSVRLRNVKATK